MSIDRIKTWIKKTGAAVYIWAILLALLGLLMLIRPGAVITIVSSLISIVLLVFGIIFVIRFATKSREQKGMSNLTALVLGILLIVVGFYMLRNPAFLASAAGTLLAVYLTAYGIIRLIRALRSPVKGYGLWWNSFVGAILTLFFGILFLFRPLTGPEIILRLAGLALIYAAVSSILFGVRAGKSIHETGERIQDAVHSYEDEMSRRTGKDLYGREIIESTAEFTDDKESK